MKLITLAALLFLSFSAIADGEIDNSTSTGNVNVIGGDTSMFGSSGGERIVVTNLKEMYNGAQAGSYRVIWPYIYSGSLRQCNISSGKCTWSIPTYILTPSGLIVNTGSHGIGPATVAPTQTFYHWTK